jgi:hypothetical protein
MSLANLTGLYFPQEPETGTEQAQFVNSQFNSENHFYGRQATKKDKRL